MLCLSLSFVATLYPELWTSLDFEIVVQDCKASIWIGASVFKSPDANIHIDSIFETIAG